MEQTLNNKKSDDAVQTAHADETDLVIASTARFSCANMVGCDRLRQGHQIAWLFAELCKCWAPGAKSTHDLQEMIAARKKAQAYRREDQISSLNGAIDLVRLVGKMTRRGNDFGRECEAQLAVHHQLQKMNIFYRSDFSLLDLFVACVEALGKRGYLNFKLQGPDTTVTWLQLQFLLDMATFLVAHAAKIVKYGLDLEDLNTIDEVYVLRVSLLRFQDNPLSGQWPEPDARFDDR